MIGDMIWEFTGKVIGTRLEKHDGMMKLERTIEAKGKVLGEDATLLTTTWSMERPQKGMFAMGHGMIMTKKGDKVMLKGAGITPGGVPVGSFRGARYAQTSSSTLARLNNVVLVFEIEFGVDGSFKDKTWEWK